MTEHIGADLYLIVEGETILGKNSGLEDDSTTGPTLAVVTRFNPPLEKLVNLRTFPIPPGLPTTKQGLLEDPMAIMAIRTGGGKTLLEVDASLFPQP